MRRKEIIVEAGGQIHWSNGEVLGKCEFKRCGADASFFNEDGELRCPECLMEELTYEDSENQWI